MMNETPWRARERAAAKPCRLLAFTSRTSTGPFCSIPKRWPIFNRSPLGAPALNKGLCALELVIANHPEPRKQCRAGLIAQDLRSGPAIEFPTPAPDLTDESRVAPRLRSLDQLSARILQSPSACRFRGSDIYLVLAPFARGAGTRRFQRQPRTKSPNSSTRRGSSSTSLMPASSNPKKNSRIAAVPRTAGTSAEAR